MYLSATLQPILHQGIKSSVITDKIDNFKADDEIFGTDVVNHEARRFHFNAQTLKLKTKRECFAKQLRWSTLWAAFAETRLQDDGIIKIGVFIAAMSKADAGGYGGCAIWINTTIATGTLDGEEAFISEDHVTIIHGDPRRLFVAIKSRTVCCCWDLPSRTRCGQDAGGHQAVVGQDKLSVQAADTETCDGDVHVGWQLQGPVSKRAAHWRCLGSTSPGLMKSICTRSSQSTISQS